MPIYEYMCHTCGKEFEAIQKFSDEPLTSCTCGKAGRVERKLSLSAFQLKGGGWYKDLYGNGKNGSSGSGSGSSASKSGGTDSAKSGASSSADSGTKASDSGSTKSGSSEGAKSGAASTPASS